jgi:uncharacterized protein YlzI (FlbEa/FlbD family)
LIQVFSEVVRASSLSNLATFCEVIKFGIHPFINQIFNHTIQLIQVEKEKIVKRSCLQVFNKLLYCMDESIFETIDLKRLVQILKNLEYFETSLEIKENANIVLNQIQEYSRSILFVSESQSTLKFL